MFHELRTPWNQLTILCRQGQFHINKQNTCDTLRRNRCLSILADRKAQKNRWTGLGDNIHDGEREETRGCSLRVLGSTTKATRPTNVTSSAAGTSFMLWIDKNGHNCDEVMNKLCPSVEDMAAYFPSTSLLSLSRQGLIKLVTETSRENMSHIFMLKDITFTYWHLDIHPPIHYRTEIVYPSRSEK